MYGSCDGLAMGLVRVSKAVDKMLGRSIWSESDMCTAHCAVAFCVFRRLSAQSGKQSPSNLGPSLCMEECLMTQV